MNCVILGQFYFITGSVFKLKKQDNLTDFMLNDNETIVSVIPGMKTKLMIDIRFPLTFLRIVKADRW